VIINNLIGFETMLYICFYYYLGIWDNYCVKNQMLTLAIGLSQQLLLVDEIIKAGKQMGPGPK
jgi:chaperonin GroEL (HSP60 family)